MIDKPIAAKIILSLKTKESIQDFLSFPNSLYKNNLIFDQPREIRINNNNLEIIVIFRELNAFQNWQDDEEIIKNWSKKFTNFLSKKPITIKETDIFVEIDNLFNCSCEKSTFLILYGRNYNSLNNELICCDCGGEIPYSRVSKNINLEEWQKHYQRIYMNWLDSWIFEKEALAELKNYKDGKLNLEGEKIRKLLEEHFKTPVFIKYFEEEPGESTNCLICNENGTESGLECPKYFCTKCNTTF